MLVLGSARTGRGDAPRSRTTLLDCLASGMGTGALALAVAIVSAGSVWATTPIDPGAGEAVRAQHVSYESADGGAGTTSELTAAGSEAPVAITGTSGALVINATFDASITGDPNSAAIQAMINDAIAIYQSSFNDPITVSIRFRYATTLPDGSPMPSGSLAISVSTVYLIPWNTYISALTADATTGNDATANASLPGSALSTNIVPTSAGGRAVSLNTPPAMFADGSVGVGGPYDGIVTLNSSKPFKFTRPPASGMFDALRTTEHEMDEVLGLGSGIGVSADRRPQDLFSWSAPGTRSFSSSGSRYFSIDSGTTNIVGFNQNPSGDFGDWLSASCPQATPYVQNAFSCANQASDVTQTSPEGINLDVVGYDLIIGPTTTTTTTTSTTTTTTTTTTTLPFGGEDPGCVPANQNRLKCGDTIVKAAAKLFKAVDKCHCTQAKARLGGVATANTDEEACEESNGGKAAKEKYDAAKAKLVTLGICTPTQLANMDTLRDDLLAYLDGARNVGIYCDGSTPIGGDDMGNVPSSKNVLGCECSAGKNAAKLYAAALQCHFKNADGVFKQKVPPFNEEACEETAGGKGAHDKYTAAAGKLIAKGTCPPCLDSAAEHEALATADLGVAESKNDKPYPCE